MNWTNKEKIAILKSIGFIIGADGKIHPNEIKILQGFCNRYGLNIDIAMKEQDIMSASEMRKIISSMSQSDKQTIKSFWMEAMTCDGNVDDREAETIALMMLDCDIH